MTLLPPRETERLVIDNGAPVEGAVSHGDSYWANPKAAADNAPAAPAFETNGTITRPIGFLTELVIVLFILV